MDGRVGITERFASGIILIPRRMGRIFSGIEGLGILATAWAEEMAGDLTIR